MQDADAFDGTRFLGLARSSKRDPYRLSLFAQHLGAEERPLVFLSIQGGSLIVTDDRVLELRAHLEVHGAWNVKEFQGYAVHRAIDRGSVRDLAHDLQSAQDAAGTRRVEDRLRLVTDEGPVEFLVSNGPEATLPEDEFLFLRAAVLANHAK